MIRSFEENHKRWIEREIKRPRTKYFVKAFVQQLLNGNKFNWELLCKIHRGSQLNPKASCLRLLKQKEIKKMISDELKNILTEKGINENFVLDKLLVALNISEDKKDANTMLKAIDNMQDLLDMKPMKINRSESFQIKGNVDLKAIADGLETEKQKKQDKILNE
jgi:hypothetical protein